MMGSLFLDRVSNKALGQLLVEKGALTEAQLEHALQIARESKLRLGQALLSLNYVSQDSLQYALAEQYGTRPVELGPQMVDMGLVSRYPIDLLRDHKMMPLIEFDYEIIVLVADLADQSGLRALETYSPRKTLTPQLADEKQIRHCLEMIVQESAKSKPQAGVVSKAAFEREIWSLDQQADLADANDDGHLLKSLFRAAASVWPAFITARLWNGKCQLMASGAREIWRPDSIASLPADAIARIRTAAEAAGRQVPYCDGRVTLLKPVGRLHGETFTLEIADVPSAEDCVLRIQALAHRDPSHETHLEGRLGSLAPGNVVTIKHACADELHKLLPAALATLGQLSMPALFCATAAVRMAGVPTFRLPFVRASEAIQALRPHCVIYDAPISRSQFAELRASLPYEPLWVFFRPQQTGNENEANANGADDGSLPSHLMLEPTDFPNEAEPHRTEGRN